MARTTQELDIAAAAHVTERELVKLSESTNGPIYAICRYGLPQRLGSYVIATASADDEEGMKRLRELFDTLEPTDSETLQTWNGEVTLPNVLAIRCYFNGVGTWERAADTETFEAIRDRNRAFRDKRSKVTMPLDKYFGPKI